MGDTSFLDKLKSNFYSEDQILAEMNRISSDLYGYAGRTRMTPLIYACKKNYPRVALRLIKSGQAKPEYVGIDKRTALDYAVRNRMNEVVFALLATRRANQQQLSSFGATALTTAIRLHLTDIALAIVNAGDFNPTAVDSFNNLDALTIAVAEGMTDVALAILNKMNYYIDTAPPEIVRSMKKSYEIANQTGQTELANRLKLKSNGGEAVMAAAPPIPPAMAREVAAAPAPPVPEVEPEDNEPMHFNTNAKCLDLIMAEEVPISEALKEGNLVFVFYDGDITKTVNSTLSREDFTRQAEDKDNIVYECKNGDGRLGGNNVIRNIGYFDIKKVAGFGQLASMDDINYILQNTDKQIFLFKKSNRWLKSTVAYEVINNLRESWEGARHCQEGQGGFLYKIQKNVIFDDEAQVAGKRRRKKTMRRRKNSRKSRKHRR